ncbi:MULTISPECIES: hypothetical protein [Streptococcus]|uniref:hypothetical protein n=1 Tax=Streptococcus TaxID=1301 RepID=UPI0003D35D4C|nr:MULTISPECIES: hypothetical protein [Streptococcus]ETE04144.1 hypothetical protein U750_09785 [Streptococcus pseudopneumoniae G42]MBF9617958.1 hypothetical protein [Streptococcus pseudopneumoniae]MBF9678550.1 hypothetical protein [Streptococcus pseudopneumoniae]TMR47068.1 hypothetical protein E3V84_04100 [Streptococcus pseudopneumoniae]
MEFIVYRKGREVAVFQRRSDAERYVHSRTGFFGEPDAYYQIEQRGCYLTEAAVTYKGLADDCDELMILRKFRDSYLAFKDGGIVAKLEEHSNREEILESIWSGLVLPCVSLIKIGENQTCHQLYKTYTLELSQKVVQ